MVNIEKIKKDLACWEITDVSKYIRNKELVNYLYIENRTDILLECISRDNFIFFEEAIKNGFNYENSMFNHIHSALRSNKIKFFNYLLENSSIEYISRLERLSNDNLLHSCFKIDGFQNKEIILKLSKMGISWNQYNQFKHTPLHMLIRNNKCLSNEIVDEIILKADFSLKDINGFDSFDIIKSMSLDNNWSQCPNVKYLMERLNNG